MQGLFPNPNFTQLLLFSRLAYDLKKIKIKKLRNAGDLFEEWQPSSSFFFPKYCILRARVYADLVISFHSSAG